MCGRFTLATPEDIVAEFFRLGDVPDLSPRYNIAPAQPAPVVRIDTQRRSRRLSMLRWGLIPAWARDPSMGQRMINARCETVASKPAFRVAFKHRRCLVVADGFYEWRRPKSGRHKQPYYIRMQDGALFAFAGLWEHWEGPTGSAIDSCTVLTTEPNELMQPLHDRMPVILPPADYDAWLDPDVRSAGPLQALLRPYPAKALTAFPVSTLVNKPGNDAAVCIEPLEE